MWILDACVIELEKSPPSCQVPVVEHQRSAAPTNSMEAGCCQRVLIRGETWGPSGGRHTLIKTASCRTNGARIIYCDGTDIRRTALGPCADWPFLMKSTPSMT